MSLFKKIKQNLNHGGVKIRLEAPSTIAKSQTSVPVKVTLNATEQCQVNSIEVTLERHTVNAGSNRSSPPAPTVFGTAKHDEPFMLSPNQNQTFEISLTIPSADSGGALGKSFGKLANVVSSLNSQTFTHYIHAKADVAKISMDPEAKLQIVWEGNEMPSLTRNTNVTIS